MEDMRKLIHYLEQDQKNRITPTHIAEKKTRPKNVSKSRHKTGKSSM